MCIFLTNISSSGSKVSMASLGYVDDPFIKCFCNRIERRTSLINRGYFVRVWAIYDAVERFVTSHPSVQVVNLGAGFDTLFFRLRRKHKSLIHKFVEVDFMSVIVEKVNKLQQNLNGLFPDEEKEVNVDGQTLGMFQIGSHYSLVGCDLRDENLFSKLIVDCKLSPDIPTLFITECVLNYLKPEESNTLLQTLRSSFHTTAIIAYEQIVPNDAFGLFMQRHFKSIGSPLQSIDKYPTSSSQEARFKQLGWQYVRAVPVALFYKKFLPEDEKVRVEALEPFDEYEMLHLKLSHYVLVFASSTFGTFQRYHQHLTSDLVSSQLFERSVISASGIDISRFQGAQRFGHRVVAVGTKVYYIGGWGCEFRKHRRLRNVFALDCSTMENSLSYPTETPFGYPTTSGVERLYCTATVVNDGKVFLFGGRKSPLSPLDVPCLLRIDGLQCTVKHLCFTGEDRPLPRFRHAACLINSEEPSVFLCGGITVSATKTPVILSDCWIAVIGADNRWLRLHAMPVALHSHSCAYLPSTDCVYVLGGLTERDPRLSTVLYFYSVSTKQWCAHSDFSRSPVFYGHSCLRVTSSQLLVAGGLDQRGEENRTVILLNFDTLSQETFVLPENLSASYMCVNHDVALIFDGDKMCAFFCGGGGNCFSFGTVLNQSILKAELPAPSLVRQLE